MSFRGNNVLHHYHQKITRDTHGKGAAMSSGHWIKSCQLLHDAQQLCIKVSCLERYFPGWAWPTAGSCFLSGEQQLQALVLSEDEWNHSSVQFLPSSWTYLHYFRWLGKTRRHLHRNGGQTPYFCTKSSFWRRNGNLNPQPYWPFCSLLHMALFDICFIF